MKKILFICPEFFDYHKRIVSELENQGYVVKWFSDHLKKVSLFRMKVDKEYSARKQVENIISSTEGKEFDIVFIIFAGRFTRNMICELKTHFSNAIFIYYAWDSFSSYPNIASWYDLMDKSYSFDPEDCQKYGLGFRPLFFSVKPEVGNSIEYDASSVMTIQPSKAQKYNKIIESLPSGLKLFQYLYFPSRLLFKINKIRHKKHISHNIVENIKFNKLTYLETLKAFSSSKAVIDCQYKDQKGLTIRTFEVLSMKKKLITTNSEIKKYEFYSPNNIFVIGDEKKVPDSFFNEPFDESYCLSDKYSISSFVTDIIN